MNHGKKYVDGKIKTITFLLKKTIEGRGGSYSDFIKLSTKSHARDSRVATRTINAHIKHLIGRGSPELIIPSCLRWISGDKEFRFWFNVSCDWVQVCIKLGINNTASLQ